MASFISRNLDLHLEPLETLTPLSGLFRDLPQPGYGLKNSLQPVFEGIANGTINMIAEELELQATICLEKAEDKIFMGSTNLTRDLFASVTLYSCEFATKEKSLYAVLNGRLRSADREGLKPFIRYVWLVMHALELCTPFDGRLVYRGVSHTRLDIGQYRPGRKLTWFQFSSCASSIEVQNAFLGTSGERYLLIIELTTSRARVISDLSLFPQEMEVLLPPNTRIEVMGILEQGGLTIINLKELEPLDPILRFGGRASVAIAPAPAPAPTQTPQSPSTSQKPIFFSLRFNDPTKAAAQLVARDLQNRGIKCIIVDATGGSISQCVSSGILDCAMFLMLATFTYGEDTGTPGCTAEEYAYARQLKKKIFAIRMIPYGESFKESSIDMAFAGKLFPIWLPNSSTHQWSEDGVEGGTFKGMIDQIAEAYERAVNGDSPRVTAQPEASELQKLCEKYEGTTVIGEVELRNEFVKLIERGKREIPRSKKAPYSAEMSGIPWPKSMELLGKRSGALITAKGTLSVTTDVYPSSMGDVRTLYKAVVHDEAKGTSTNVVLKEFMRADMQILDSYQSQSERSAYACYLVKTYNETHSPSKRLVAVPSRVLKVTKPGGVVVLYNMEDEISGGEFVKWTNNLGYKAQKVPRDLVDLSLWTYEASNGYLMLTGLQGVETSDAIVVTNPTILCRDTERFLPTNLGPAAMEMCLSSLRGAAMPRITSGPRTVRLPGYSASDAENMCALGRCLREVAEKAMSEMMRQEAANKEREEATSQTKETPSTVSENFKVTAVLEEREKVFGKKIEELSKAEVATLVRHLTGSRAYDEAIQSDGTQALTGDTLWVAMEKWEDVFAHFNNEMSIAHAKKIFKYLRERKTEQEKFTTLCASPRPKEAQFIVDVDGVPAPIVDVEPLTFEHHLWGRHEHSKDIFQGKLSRPTTSGKSSNVDVVIKVQHPSRNIHREKEIYELLRIAKAETGCETGCVKMYGADLETERPFLVLEQFGRDLRSRFVPTLNVKVLHDFVESMLGAVQHLHSLNIIHNDIKPSNFVVRMDEQSSKVSIKLCDLDSACEKGHEYPYEGEVPKFTEGWMSAEVWFKFRGFPKSFLKEGRLKATVASDIFSLGLVFATLLDSTRSFEKSILPTRDTGDDYTDVDEALASQENLNKLINCDADAFARAFKRVVVTMCCIDLSARPTAAGVQDLLQGYVTSYYDERDLRAQVAQGFQSLTNEMHHLTEETHEVKGIVERDHEILEHNEQMLKGVTDKLDGLLREVRVGLLKLTNQGGEALNRLNDISHRHELLEDIIKSQEIRGIARSRDENGVLLEKMLSALKGTTDAMRIETAASLTRLDQQFEQLKSEIPRDDQRDEKEQALRDHMNDVKLSLTNMEVAVASLQKAVKCEHHEKMLDDLNKKMQDLTTNSTTEQAKLSEMMQALRTQHEFETGMLRTLIKDTHKVPTLVFLIRELPTGLRRASPLRLVRNTYRLFFICSHTHQIVHCGPDKMGYVITVPTAWVKYAAPVLQIGLGLAKLALQTYGIPLPIPNLLEAVADNVVELQQKLLDVTLLDMKSVGNATGNMASTSFNNAISSDSNPTADDIISATGGIPAPLDGFGGENNDKTLDQISSLLNAPDSFSNTADPLAAAAAIADYDKTIDGLLKQEGTLSIYLAIQSLLETQDRSLEHTGLRQCTHRGKTKWVANLDPVEKSFELSDVPTQDAKDAMTQKRKEVCEEKLKAQEDAKANTLMAKTGRYFSGIAKIQW